MPTKRKSDAMQSESSTVAGTGSVKVLQPSVKKARLANIPATSTSETEQDKPQSWKDITLPGEDDVRVYIGTFFI